MAPTFYGVLGVGPDADAEGIERGYRERVTEVHPDVNDAPDADAQFKRLTTARETLLDADERSRYDRLGHASYVRHHVTCSAWESTVSGTTGASSVSDGDGPNRREQSTSNGTDGPESAPGERGQGKTRPGNGSGARDRDWNTGRRRSAREKTGGPGSPGPSSATAGGDSRTGSRSTRTDSSESAATGSARTATGGGAHAWSAHDRSSRRRSRASAGADAGAAGKSAHATSSLWEDHRVGQRFGGRNSPRVQLLVRLVRGMRALGVWALIHVVFLAAAVGTSWYVYAVVLDASTASLPLLLVLVGEVVLATVLSSIHVLTRIYR